jgi:hypothetical protein
VADGAPNSVTVVVTFNCSSTIIWHHIAMPDEHPLAAPSAPRGAEALTLHQADQARTDLAVIESNLEFIMSQLARVPMRTQLARYSLLLMVGTACLVQTLAFLFR